MSAFFLKFIWPRKQGQNTLNEYISLYIEQIATGKRQTEQGRNYARSTVKTVRYSLRQFAQFQETTNRQYDFSDIDMTFYYDYTAFLKKKGFSINSVGKCIRDLKVILHAAEIEGLNSHIAWKEKRFKGIRVEVDSIYLTPDDLRKMMSVDFATLSPEHEQARDIFMVGVWTAQRISDYNHIKPEDFDNLRGITYLNIRQQKTGVKVAIPCNTALKTILEKYNYRLPHLSDRVINRDIKDVARAAGLTGTVEIETTKGGTPKKERVPKWKLVHSHTARRTGATLMYLAGVDLYDIMKITGHTTPAMLKKYIKADSQEVVEKLAGKYDYFR